MFEDIKIRHRPFADGSPSADTDAIAARLNDQGIRARPETRPALEGVGEEILRVAREEDADLIMMGFRGPFDLSGLYLGTATSVWRSPGAGTV
jgi:nucleotide-binding universal stress UspA family protein